MSDTRTATDPRLCLECGCDLDPTLHPRVNICAACEEAPCGPDCGCERGDEMSACECCGLLSPDVILQEDDADSAYLCRDSAACMGRLHAALTAEGLGEPLAWDDVPY